MKSITGALNSEPRNHWNLIVKATITLAFFIDVHFADHAQTMHPTTCPVLVTIPNHIDSARFRQYDANQDGNLDATEQKARDQCYETVRQQFIKKYDKNRNGKIDPEEIRPAAPAKPAC